MFPNILQAQDCPAYTRTEVKVAVMSTLCDLIDCSLPSSSVHGILQVRVLEWVASSFSKVPGDLPNPGTKPGCPALQADSLPTEPLGKSCIYTYTFLKVFTLSRITTLLKNKPSLFCINTKKLTLLTPCLSVYYSNLSIKKSGFIIQPIHTHTHTHTHTGGSYI